MCAVSTHEPLCLACQTHIDYAEMLSMDIEIRDRRIRELERKVYRLDREQEEKRLSIKHTEEAVEFLAAWDELRRQYFKDSRDVNLAPDSSRAVKYRKARKTYSHEELMNCLRGLALSDHHVSDKRYFELNSFLREDERIEKHMARYEAAQRLREKGFTNEEFIRSAVQRPVVHLDNGWPRCPGCESAPCRCGSEAEQSTWGKEAA